MKKKGFTLVELLVVIAIIAMLLAILMPALGKVRQLAQRLICGTNISGIGKAMMVYSNDDEYEQFPIAGPSGTILAVSTTTAPGECSWAWDNPSEPTLTSGGDNLSSKNPAEATVSASLFLLVKYADVSPDQFICAGSEQKKFELAKYEAVKALHTDTESYTDVWDFGSYAFDSSVYGKGHCSYSYQLPYPVKQNGLSYPASTTTNPGSAILADRNPFFDKSASSPAIYTLDTNKELEKDSIAAGNASSHQQEGQNVLYADIHVKFEKQANCGVEQDNIYTVWGCTKAELTDATRIEKVQCGDKIPTVNGVTDDDAPQDSEDNYLISDNI